MPVVRKGEAFPQDRRRSRSSAPARLMVIWTSLPLTPPPSANGLTYAMNFSYGEPALPI